MAELILTESEKATESYLDWDDVALGRFTKHVALKLASMKNDSTGLHKVTMASIAMMLVGGCVEANATKLELDLEDHTHNAIHTGDWQITVNRKV